MTPEQWIIAALAYCWAGAAVSAVIMGYDGTRKDILISVVFGWFLLPFLVVIFVWEGTRRRAWGALFRRAWHRLSGHDPAMEREDL